MEATMLGKLFLLFTITTSVELFLLIKIGQLMGLGATLALILTTGLLGAWLAKREGIKTLSKLRQQLAQGQLPGDALLDGVCILVAGTFLLTPGILTDAAGFVLLVPPLRAPIKAAIRAAFQRAVREGRANAKVAFVQGHPGGSPDAQAFAAMFDRGSAARPDSVARPPRGPYVSGDIIDVTDA